MSTRFFFFSLLLCIGACALPADEDIGHTDEAISFSFPFSYETPPLIAVPAPPPPPTIEVPAGCNRNVMIGVAEVGHHCPSASGSWNGGTALSGLRTTGGDAICRYEFSTTALRWSLDGLPSDSGGYGFRYVEREPHEWLEPDCNAVMPLGDPAVDETLTAVTSAHQRAWRDQIGRVNSLPIVQGARRSVDLPARVNVAILDDVEASDLDDPEFPITGTSHGQSVALAIRDVVCPTGRPGNGCPVHFQSYPVIRPGTSAEGSIYALAQSIMVAAVNGADVINLSVGFDGRYAWHGDEENKTYYERAKVLRAALEYAACQGAIVIAAAGNDGQGRGVGANESPMYPAAFASENRRSCSNRSVETSEPLVYIASGVGPGDEDVPNTRPGSRGELAAPAFAVTFDDRRPGALEDRLPLRTGSSFGAAGVSAVAALVRAYLPEATPTEVMSMVLGSSVDLGREAYVCNTRALSLAPLSHCNTHRVSACAAVDAALAQVCEAPDYAFSCSWARYGFRCDTPAAGEPTGPAPTDFDPDQQASEVLQLAYTSSDVPGVQGCRVGTVMAHGTQDHFCPDEAYDNGMNSPGTSGQPGDDPCRVCGIKIRTGDFVDEYTLVLGLDPAITDSLSSPTLRVDDQVFGLGEDTLAKASDGRLVGVRLPPLRYTPASATLSFQYGTKKSLSSQLPIW